MKGWNDAVLRGTGASCSKISFIFGQQFIFNFFFANCRGAWGNVRDGEDG